MLLTAGRSESRSLENKMRGAEARAERDFSCAASPKRYNKVPAGVLCHVTTTQHGGVERDRAFLQWFLKMLMMLCATQFLTMPVTFLLAFFSGLYAAYTFIFIKYCAVLKLQHLLWQSFEGWARKQMASEFQYMQLALDKFKVEWPSAAMTTCEVVFALVALLCHLAGFVVGSIDVIDPDMDTISVSASFAMLSEKQIMHFKATWQHLFILGRVIELFGLSGMLAAGLLVITGIQLHSLRWAFNGPAFCVGKFKVEDGPLQSCDGIPVAQYLFAGMHHMADISGLLVIKAGLREVWIAQNTHVYDRQCSFGPKSILETAFSAWFQISLAALTFDTATRIELTTVAFSIASSFVVAAQGMLAMAPCLIHWYRIAHWQDFAPNACYFAFGLILFTAMAVRVAGIWVCRSHVLNLTSGCMPIE